jgi:hypothetical protein
MSIFIYYVGKVNIYYGWNWILWILQIFIQNGIHNNNNFDQFYINPNPNNMFSYQQFWIFL